MRLKQNVIYQKVCESLEKDRVYLRPSLSLSELSVIVGTTITQPARSWRHFGGAGACGEKKRMRAAGDRPRKNGKRDSVCCPSSRKNCSQVRAADLGTMALAGYK